MRTISLRTYRGKELLYNKNGEPKNETQVTKITDGTEWLNFLKYIKAQQLCKVELINVTEKGVPVKDTALLESQLLAACKDGLECEILLPKEAKEEVKESKDDAKAYRESLKAKAIEKGIEFAKNISTPDLEKLVS